MDTANFTRERYALVRITCILRSCGLLNSTDAVFLVTSSRGYRQQVTRKSGVSDEDYREDVRNKSGVSAKTLATMSRGCYAEHGPVEFKLIATDVLTHSVVYVHVCAPPGVYD